MITYTVKAFCCTSGNCVTCLAGHNRNRRVLGIICTTTDKVKAERVKRNWPDHDARIEEEEKS
jgi:hypothetical protein